MVSPMEIPESWRTILEAETQQTYFTDLLRFLEEERQTHTVFPAVENVFAALESTPPDEANVLLLGQDPYHDDGQAHGLCFSVLPGVKTPPSLKNVYKELESDIGCPPPDHGYLASWAKQGILMLNTVLTVRAHEANSHKKKGWEKFTDAIIKAMDAKESPVVFVLWGKPAQKKTKLISGEHHVIIQSPHPSPLSARRGFFGSQPFSKINAALANAGHRQVDWQLPETVSV